MAAEVCERCTGVGLGCGLVGGFDPQFWFAVCSQFCSQLAAATHECLPIVNRSAAAYSAWACNLCLRKGLETRMKARWFRTCGMLLACASLSVFAACGDDSGTDAGTAGAGGAAGASGASGAAGAAGAAGKAGGGGGGSAALTCGGSACTVNATLKIVNAAAQACCTADMKCGAYNSNMKCLPTNGPGKADTSCPTISVTVMGMAYPQTGCCTPAGQCGNSFDAVGWGCVTRTDIASDMGGPLTALACGAGDSGADAGL
jgi:hypothetical protein